MKLSRAPCGRAPATAVARGPRAQAGLALRARPEQAAAPEPGTPASAPHAAPGRPRTLAQAHMPSQAGSAPPAVSCPGTPGTPRAPGVTILSPSRASEPWPGRPADTRCDVRPHAVPASASVRGPCPSQGAQGEGGRAVLGPVVSTVPSPPAVSGSERECDSRPGQDGRPCRPEAPHPLGASPQLCSVVSVRSPPQPGPGCEGHGQRRDEAPPRGPPWPWTAGSVGFFN